MSARAFIAITLLVTPFMSLANNGLNLGLSLSQSFEDAASIEADIGFRSNSWLFTLGLDNNFVSDTELTSQIVYTVNKSDDYSIDIGVGLAGTSPVLSYGVYRSIFKQFDAGLSIKTVFGANNEYEQKAYFNIRYYLNDRDSDTSYISTDIKPTVPVEPIDIFVAETAQPELEYSQKSDVIEPVSQPKEHIVVKDEWLLKLSRMYGVRLDKILLVNPDITNPDVIFPGQLIIIPEEIDYE